MGFKYTQTITCIHNESLTEEVVVQSKWKLHHDSYPIDFLEGMEDTGDIISHYEGNNCNPFYCWNDAMEVVDKIELTPCNEGFPHVVMTGRYFSIEVDGETFLQQREVTDNKLQILEEVVYDFLKYYYDNVKNMD